MALMTMEKFFKKANLDVALMEKNTFYDVSEYNFKIKSYNIESEIIEYKKVLSVVRKDNTEEYHLVDSQGNIILKCSGMHKIYDTTSKKYIHVEDIKDGTMLSDTKGLVPFTVEETNIITPIVDMQVEGNHNYFGNGVLFSNTTPGGNAPKFFASIRCEIRKGKKREGASDEDDALGTYIRVKNVKNKTCIPYRKGEIYCSFTDGVDVATEYLNFAVSFGIIDKKGSWYSYKDAKLGQGAEKSAQALKDDETLYQEIKDRVTAKLQDVKLGTSLNIKEDEEGNIVNSVVVDTASLASLALD